MSISNNKNLRFAPKQQNDFSTMETNTTFSYEIISTLESTGVHFRTSEDPGSYIPAHLHNAIEIIYLLEGSLTVTTKNNNQEYHAGECILINPNVVHATKCTKANTAILFQIPLSFLSLYIEQPEQLVFHLDTENRDAIKNTKIAVFKETLMKMKIATDVQPEGYILRFNSLLFEILFQLFHNFSTRVVQDDQSQRSKDKERLNTILDYIKKNYDRHISIEEIAGIAYLQPSYFCRFFKKCTGITFLEYQNELRLSYIYQDLLSTDDSVKNILERHGFTNYKLFRKIFYEHFGTTPTKLRKEKNGRKQEKRTAN